MYNTIIRNVNNNNTDSIKTPNALKTATKVQSTHNFTWDMEMNQLKTRWPGTTRNNRARAAVALLDRREDVEGRKVIEGLFIF